DASYVHFGTKPFAGTPPAERSSRPTDPDPRRVVCAERTRAAAFRAGSGGNVRREGPARGLVGAERTQARCREPAPNEPKSAPRDGRRSAGRRLGIPEGAPRKRQASPHFEKKPYRPPSPRDHLVWPWLRSGVVMGRA